MVKMMRKGRRELIMLALLGQPGDGTWAQKPIFQGQCALCPPVAMVTWACCNPLSWVLNWLRIRREEGLFAPSILLKHASNLFSETLVLFSKRKQYIKHRTFWIIKRWLSPLT